MCKARDRDLLCSIFIDVGPPCLHNQLLRFLDLDRFVVYHPQHTPVHYSICDRLGFGYLAGKMDVRLVVVERSGGNSLFSSLKSKSRSVSDEWTY